MYARIFSSGALQNADRVMIEAVDGGAYFFIFRSETSTFPEFDWFPESIEGAKAHAAEEYGAAEDSWLPFVGKSLV